MVSVRDKGKPPLITTNKPALSDIYTITCELDHAVDLVWLSLHRESLRASFQCITLFCDRRALILLQTWPTYASLPATTMSGARTFMPEPITLIPPPGQFQVCEVRAGEQLLRCSTCKDRFYCVRVYFQSCCNGRAHQYHPTAHISTSDDA